MGERPLRIQRIDDVIVCSNRTFQNEHLLPTDPLSNQLMLGKLGLLTAAYDIELFAYSFLPNGFWLLLSDPAANKAHLMRDFQSWLALRQNDALHREGKFFHERYDDKVILDAQMLVDTYVDVLVAPVREGFTHCLDDFAGATSWQWLNSGEAPIGTWIDRDKLRSLRRSNPELSEEEVAHTFPVEIASPPVEGLGLEVDDEEAVARWLERKILDRVDDILEWQATVGVDEVLEKRAAPHQTPWTARKTEPLGPPKYRYSYTCRTYSEEHETRYLKIREDKRTAYTDARRVWRRASPIAERDERDATRAQGTIESLALKFPTGTFPPGWTRMRQPLDIRHPDAAPKPRGRAA